MGGGSWSPPATPRSETGLEKSPQCSPAALSEAAWSPPLYNPTPEGIPQATDAGHLEQGSGLHDGAGIASSRRQHQCQALDVGWINLPETLDDDPADHHPALQPGPMNAAFPYHKPAAGAEAQQTGSSPTTSAPNLQMSHECMAPADENVSPSGQGLASGSQQPQQHMLAPRMQDAQPATGPRAPGEVVMAGSHQPQGHQQLQQQPTMTGGQSQVIAGERPASKQQQQQQQGSWTGMQGHRSSGVRPCMNQAMSQQQPGSSQQPRRSGGSNWLLQAARATGQLPAAPRPSHFPPSQRCSAAAAPAISRQSPAMPQAVQSNHDSETNGSFCRFAGRLDSSATQPCEQHDLQTITDAGAHADPSKHTGHTDAVPACNGAPATSSLQDDQQAVDDEAIPPTPLSCSRGNAEHATGIRSALLSPSSKPLAQRFDAAAVECSPGATLGEARPNRLPSQAAVPLATRMSASWPQDWSSERSGADRTAGECSMDTTDAANPPSLKLSSDIPLAARVEAFSFSNAAEGSLNLQHSSSFITRSDMEVAMKGAPEQERPLADRLAEAPQHCSKPSQLLATDACSAALSAGKGASGPGNNMAAQQEDRPLAQRFVRTTGAVHDCEQLHSLSQVRDVCWPTADSAMHLLIYEQQEWRHCVRKRQCCSLSGRLDSIPRFTAADSIVAYHYVAC